MESVKFPLCTSAAVVLLKFPPEKSASDTHSTAAWDMHGKSKTASNTMVVVAHTFFI
jgi:hypothetical protein